MAKVEMDLAELKQLEKQIEDLKIEKQTLLDNQQQVVIYHKYFNGKIKYPTQVSKNGYDIKVGYIQFNKWSREITESNTTLDYLIDHGFLQLDLTEDSHRSTKDYKNLSEIIDQIRREEYGKVEDQIKSLKKIISDKDTLIYLSEKSLNELKNDQNSKISDITNNLIKEYDEKITNLTKEKDKIIEQLNVKYNHLSDEFEEFKTNKKRVTLEEQLNTLIEQNKVLEEQNKELEKQLNIITNKSFFKRLFNK